MKRTDFEPVGCTEAEMRYIIVNTFDNSPLKVGFQYSHQATRYISQLVTDMDDCDEIKFEGDDDEYEVITISEIVKPETDWGQTIIIVLAILFGLYVVAHIF